MIQVEQVLERGSRPDAYTALKSRARRALDRADFRTAETLFEWAYDEARRQGDLPLMERAYCNLTMVANATGSADRYLEGTRAILGRSTDPEARFLAAYNLAFVFDNQGARRKARFYAQVACQQAAALEDTLPAAAASYNLGRLWLGESRLQQAQRAIEASLGLLDERADLHNHALETSTLGYCLTLLKRRRRALALLEASAEAIARSDYLLYEPAVRLNFGFALLEMGDVERARRQAERALSLPCGCLDRKYALYLAGETSGILGQSDAARERFRQLGAEFYPGIPNLADELTAHRTHGFISWLA